MGLGIWRHASTASPPGKKHFTHCAGGWVGLRAGRDVYKNYGPPPVFDPWTVQLIVNRYTDYVIPAY
jgi:hypothetical protein